MKLDPSSILALSTLPLLLVACGDDEGRESDDGSASATVPSLATPPTVPSSDSDDPSATTAAAGTDSATDSGAPTSSSPTAISGTDSTSSGDPGTDPTVDPSTSTTDDPGMLGCSDDLHDVLDELGSVVQTCPPDQACYAGACIPACQAVANLKGTVGCDFWAPTPPFTYNGGGSSLDGPCYAAFVANAWNAPAHITVTRSGQAIDVTQYGKIPVSNGNTVSYDPIPPEGLPPDQVAILFLSHKPGVINGPNSLECPVPPGVLADTAVPGAGLGDAFHITSDVPLSAYDINPYGGAESYLPSASLLFPGTSWGTNHMAIAPAPSGNSMFALVVAREDNTIVKVAPASNYPGGGGQPPAPAGQTTQYTLNAGQIMQWLAPGDPFDPSGAIFESDKPIGLWTGNTYMFVQSSTLGPGGGEAAHQQIAPVSAMGNEYVGAGVVTRLIDLSPESVPYRMVGAINDTTLSYDPAPPPNAPSTLAAGQIAQFETSTPFTVRSQDVDHPFLFSQYMTGTGVTRPGCVSANQPCGLGDEEWVSLLSPKQFQNRYIFFTDPTYGTTTLVVLRAKSGGVFADVTIECLGPVTGWLPVGVEGLYEYAHVDLERGGVPAGNCGTSRHAAESDGPFGVVVWGTDAYASYGYPAGSDIAKINEVILPVPG